MSCVDFSKAIKYCVKTKEENHNSIMADQRFFPIKNEGDTIGVNIIQGMINGDKTSQRNTDNILDATPLTVGGLPTSYLKECGNLFTMWQPKDMDKFDWLKIVVRRQTYFTFIFNLALHITTVLLVGFVYHYFHHQNEDNEENFKNWQDQPIVNGSLPSKGFVHDHEYVKMWSQIALYCQVIGIICTILFYVLFLNRAMIYPMLYSLHIWFFLISLLSLNKLSYFYAQYDPKSDSGDDGDKRSLIEGALALNALQFASYIGTAVSGAFTNMALIEKEKPKSTTPPKDSIKP